MTVLDENLSWLQEQKKFFFLFNINLNLVEDYEAAKRGAAVSGENHHGKLFSF